MALPLLWISWLAAAYLLSSFEPRAAYLMHIPALTAGLCTGVAAFWRGAAPFVRHSAGLAAGCGDGPRLVPALPPFCSISSGSAICHRSPPSPRSRPAPERPLAGPGTGRLAAAALLTGTLLVGVGTRLPTFTAEHPQYSSLLYVLDHDRGSARWVVTGSPLPEELGSVGAFEGDTSRALPWTPQESGPSVRAPVVDLAPPLLETDDLIRHSDGFRLRGHLRSARSAPFVQIAFDAESAPSEVWIEGVSVPEDRARFALFDRSFRVYTVWTLPPQGASVELFFPHSTPVPLRLADRSYTLPPAAADLIAARPDTAAPNGLGDSTIVWATQTIELEAAVVASMNEGRGAGVRGGGHPGD